jgi:hypothetical protein
VHASAKKLKVLAGAGYILLIVAVLIIILEVIL